LNSRPLIAAFICACAAPALHAEPLYVIEQLIVSVNTEPDGSGDRVGQIKSGDRVEVLERQGEQAHIQFGSGQEGWVKASYLSDDPPLRVQLDQRAEELEKLKKEKAQLETELAGAKNAAAAAQANAQAAIKAASAAQTSKGAPAPAAAPVAAAPEPAIAPTAAAVSDTTPQSAPPLFEEKPMMPSRPSWLLASGSAGIALVAGFVLGWRMLDRKIRAKYGGLRIY
jgi:uncharacterized protein YgiM (DUF1202 family)